MELSTRAKDIYIRNYEKKDIEYIIRRHKELYKVEYGFSVEFGDNVEKYVLKFDECHDQEKRKYLDC